jgi:hypothetical protein
MENVWDNGSRFDAINGAIGRLPHDQIAVGIGFGLRHSPTSCVRCRAYIASLELATIIRTLELANDGERENGIEVNL